MDYMLVFNGCFDSYVHYDLSLYVKWLLLGSPVVFRDENHTRVPNNMRVSKKTLFMFCDLFL